MIIQVELSHSALLPNEFSYLVTLHITAPASDLILKPRVKEIALNSAVVLLNSSLCPCLSFRAEVGTIFALSWLITWFGHVLSESKHTLRLYDFFLSSHPLMPIYLAATVRTCRKGNERQRAESSHNSLFLKPMTETCLYFFCIVKGICLFSVSRVFRVHSCAHLTLGCYSCLSSRTQCLPVEHYPEAHICCQKGHSPHSGVQTSNPAVCSPDCVAQREGSEADRV